MGQLEKLGAEGYSFTYDKEWLKRDEGGVGLSLPPTLEAYVSKNLFPFFDNLIPEGWLLSHAEDKFKIDKKNRFAILLATGRETVGAVKVVALDETGQEIQDEQFIRTNTSQKDLRIAQFKSADGRCPYCLKALTKKQLAEIFYHPSCAKKMWNSTRILKILLDSQEPLNSFRETIYGASISGAQRKGLFKYAKGQLTPTSKGSQFIVKPQGDYSFLPENEHVTMAIAKDVGFDVPPFTIFDAGDDVGMVFAIKRFDVTDNGEQLRLEDAAQVIQQKSEDKYKSSYEQLAKAIKNYSDAPTADLFELWKRMLFSFFIGNADMHLKNWSFIELKAMQGIFRLSPCYDFLNTRLAIADEEVDVGLALNGQKHKITKDLFVNFAKTYQIGHLIDTVFDELDNWMQKTEELVSHCYLPEPKKEKYIEIVQSRYEVLRGERKDYF